MVATTIRAWHGGQHDDPRWFTSDQEWARTFGADVRLYEITASDVLELHEEDIDELIGGAVGYDADEALYEIMESRGADLVILHGWERGICYLVNPRWAKIEEVRPESRRDMPLTHAEPITGFPPDMAEKIAAELRAGEDDGWRYVVRHEARFSLIDIYDEDGAFVATWSIAR